MRVIHCPFYKAKPCHPQQARLFIWLFCTFTHQLAMTKEEATDFIALHYPTYFNKTVLFEDAGIQAVVKAIEPLESDGGEFIPTVYLEDPSEADTAFKNHLFSHLPLEEVMRRARLV